MTATLLHFMKMNGLGNDAVILDARRTPIRIGATEAQRLADRARGIGCDQVIVMEPSSDADVTIRIRNHDGTEADSSANAARCVAWLITKETGKQNPVIETNAGLLGTLVRPDDIVTVDLGPPRFEWDRIPLAEPFADTRYIELQVGPIDAPVLHSPSVVNLGSPQCIFWVDDLNAHDLGAIGPLIENHPVFAERANISFAQIASSNAMFLRTWERGAGLTKSSGTAAAAALCCAARKNLCGREASVQMLGGTMVVHWTEYDHILASGAVTLENTGSLDPASFGLVVASSAT
ncbi:MAG: diaminopimelate epimerase [Pseudomonadota bacterium]